MIVLQRQRIGTDAGTASRYIKESPDKSHRDMMTLISSEIFSLEFQFLCEDDEDKKYYWLRMWRLKRNTDFLNWCIISILKGEEIVAYKK